MFKSHYNQNWNVWCVCSPLGIFFVGVFRALGILGPFSRPALPADKKLPWKTHFF